MKTTNILALAVVVLLSSCSTAFRTGQTPDDVYYSPNRPEEEYVRTQREASRRYTRSEESYEDRYLRMKLHNPHKWDDLNDWYAYERWTLGYNSYFAPALNPYLSWNYYYNPYFSHYQFNNPYFANWAVGNNEGKARLTGPRIFNLNTYQQLPVNLKTINTKYGQYTIGNYAPSPSSKSSSSNRGNFLRELFSNNGGSYASPSPGSGSNPTSPINNSAGSSNSGSSAPVRRF